MAGTHLISHPGGLTIPEVTIDADTIIQAFLDGLTVERIPAPPEVCGCPSCRREAGFTDDDAA
jgi:hypothetical protein